jgi:hypothetical protein
MDGTMAGLAQMAEITGLKVGIASKAQLAGKSGLDILRGYISATSPRRRWASP